MSSLIPAGSSSELEDQNTRSLYDPDILNHIKLEDWPKVTFDPPISIQNPGTNLLLRPLRRSDWSRGHLTLLQQLTQVGDVSEEAYEQAWDKMKSTGMYFVTVVEDVESGQVVGTTTLFIEQKFIHDCGKRARIEDVVVSDQYRGKQLGKFLVTAMTLLAKQLGCYKISLDCRDTMIPFYESLGFNKEPSNGNFLVIRY